MSDRAIFQYGGPGYRPGDPAVRRLLVRIEGEYQRLLRAGLPQEVERVRAEVESRSTDVETRLMLVRQLVGVAIAREKAATYRQSLLDNGFTRIGFQVEKTRAKELRRVVIAEAKRLGVRVRSTENDPTSNEVQVAGDISLDVGATTLTSPGEGGGGASERSTSEVDHESASGQSSLGLKEQPVGASLPQLNLMQHIARDRGIEVPAEATKSRRAATAWISAHEPGRN